MSFPKAATMAGIPVEILGPHVCAKNGKWHCSHTEVIAAIDGVPFIASIDDLSDIQISKEEMEKIELAIAETFPDVLRLARVIARQI